MPSPIAHSAMGYVVYKLGRKSLPLGDSQKILSIPKLLVISVVFSSLPDLDVIPGLLFGNISRFHNNLTHSLFVGLAVACLIGFVAWLKDRSNLATWFFFALTCYTLHVLMDFFTPGRGVMLLWPISGERYEPAIKLFYGLHRSDGLISIRHLWMLVTELLFAGGVYLLATYLPSLKNLYRNHKHQKTNPESI